MNRNWIAIVSDVHGNLPALEVVLGDMLRFDVDEVLCLGDVANLGPAPSAALKRVRALEALTVMGNTDDYLLRPRTREDVRAPDEDTDRFLELEAWCAAQLDEADREFVRAFQPHLTLELDGVTVLAYHGSPRSYDEQIRAATPDPTLDEYLGGHPARVYLGGHTHEQFVRRYHDAIVANPGSVGTAYYVPKGAQAGVNIAVAEYALLQVVDGQPNVHLRRVPYDADLLREAVARTGMPHGDLVLGALAR